MIRTAITTATQVSEQCTPTQVLIFLLVLIVIVLLGMVWKAWGWLFHQLGKGVDARTTAPAQIRSRRTKRN